MAEIIPFGEEIISNHLPGKDPAAVYQHGNKWGQRWFSTKIGNKVKTYDPTITFKQVMGYLKRMGF